MRVLVLALSVMSIVHSVALAQSPSTANVPQSNAFRNPADRTGNTSGDSQVPEDYVIGPEDVLGINVWKEQELSSRVGVRPDGKIGLPLLNDVQASGLTPRQLQERISSELKKFINSPQVSVIVLEIKSRNVYIIGGVNRTGVYPLGGPMTIMELLVRAGGLSDFVKGEDIQILRTSNGKQIQYRFNFKRFAEGKDYKQNIQLQNGDMVIVR